MTDLNDIFGYRVYKPPPEKNLPFIEDLNSFGEVVSLIDPNADVIQDPAVQKIFQSLEGERVVKIEDLPPDFRYDGWNKKTQYDKQVIHQAKNLRQNLQPQQPVVSQNMLKANENSQKYQEEDLREAQLQAQRAALKDQELTRQLLETKIALEKEIHKQLVEQLTLRAQKQSVTPEQQALIEKLYLDLKLINPDLALATLKASATLHENPHQGPTQSASTSRVPTRQQIPTQSRSHANHAQVPQKSASASHKTQSRTVSTAGSVYGGPPQLYHNQGSIVNTGQSYSQVPKSSRTSRR